MSTLQAPALSTISQRRSTDPRRISTTLRGELDWIVMKALEKDRSRRYESASAFAADIQRYLSDEPVLACPPTTMYRFQKFARKHKPALATAAAIALCLILGTTVSAWQAARATTAEAQANANEQKAVANEAQAKDAAAAEAQQRQRAEANEQKATAQRDEVKAVNDQLQRTLYASNMNLAKSAWDQHAVSRVLSVLNQHRPKPGEPDLRGFEWHFLNRLCNADARLTLNVNNYALASVTYSPDGKRVFTSTGGGSSGQVSIAPELKCWDAETGQELFALKAGGFFTRVILSPDGKRFASAANEVGAVKVWDAQTGDEVLVLMGHTGDVATLAFSPDGKRLASGSNDGEGKVGGEVKVWNADTGQELQSLMGSVQGVAYSPDAKRLAFATAGGMIDGKQVPRSVNVLDAETGQLLLHLPVGGNNLAFSNLAFSSDGKRLASEHYDWDNRKHVNGELNVWDAQTGQEILGLNEKSDGRILFAFSPDGKRIAIGGQRAKTPRIKVCDTETGRELFTFQQHTDRVNNLAFSPDSQRLASGSYDQTLRIWDLQTGQEKQTIKGFNQLYFYNGQAVAFSPDGKRLAGVSGNTVKIWDAEFESNPKTFNIEGNFGAISSDFKQLASASRPRQGTATDTTVMIWDAATGRQTKTLKGHTNMIFGVAFSPDGKRLASGDGDPPGRGSGSSESVRIWDLETGQELFTLKGHTTRVGSLAFSPDSKRLASRSHGRAKYQLKMWDVQTGQELFTIEPPTEPNGGWSNVVFSRDGKRMASGSGSTVKVFSTQDGTELHSFNDGGRAVSTRAVAFSPDGKRLASGSSGFTIWDAENGRELLSAGTDSRINALTFSPDGNRLASTSDDGTATLWDAHSGHQTLTFEYAGDRGYSSGSVTMQSHNVAFSADGHRLASVLWDGTVRIYDATPLPEKP